MQRRSGFFCDCSSDVYKRHDLLSRVALCVRGSTASYPILHCGVPGPRIPRHFQTDGRRPTDDLTPIIHSVKNPLMTLITALHVMQTRYCDENSVRPSVRLSVTRVYCDKTVERSFQIYIPYERTFSLVF